MGALVKLAGLFQQAASVATAACVARWRIRCEIGFLGFQSSHYKVSAMLCDEEEAGEDPKWIESASRISLARAVVVHHLYSLWRDETNIPIDARVDWGQVLNTLKKVALLEELLREKAESDSLFLDEAMSGMAFMRCMIDGWETQHADPEEDLDEAAESALVFNSKMEGAFFFLDATKLRQLRNRLRQDRKQSDLRVLQEVVDSDDVLDEDDQEPIALSSKDVAVALAALPAEDRASVLASMAETVELKAKLQACQIEIEMLK